MIKLRDEPANWRDKFIAAYEGYSFYPLIALAGSFVVAYAIPIVWPEIDAGYIDLFDNALVFIWALFLIDYALRLVISRNRWEFVRSNLLDLFAVAIPAFRPLRALRIVSVLIIARRRFSHTVRDRATLYVSVAAVFIWFMAGLAVTDAERGVPGAQIETAAEGWWWAFTSLVTGGSATENPISDQGRFLQAALFITSMAIVGTISAALAAWFVDRDSSRAEAELRADPSLHKKIDELQSAVTELHRKLDAAE